MSGPVITLPIEQAEDIMDKLMRAGHELRKPPRSVDHRTREEWEILGCQATNLAYRLRDKVEARKRSMVPA